MGKQVFDKFKKSLIVLLAVFLVSTVTIGAASAADAGTIWNRAWNDGYDVGHAQGVYDANNGGVSIYQDDGNAELDEETSAVNDFNNGAITEDQLRARANNDGIEDGYLDGFNGN